MSFGALAFANPWLLAGLAALPIIYWLLRTVPPRPRQVAFPPTRIMVGLETKEKTPAKTPWWLTLIRMLAATLVILALAEPVLNPNREASLKGTGPVVLVIDNDWAAASRWALRTRLIDRLIGEAESQRRPVVIVPTASATKSPVVRIEAPTSARSAAAALQPQPFEPDRHAALVALESVLAGQPPASAVWLTDGIDHHARTQAFVARLAGLATAGLAVVEAPAGDEALGVNAALGKSGRLEARVIRAGGPAREGVVFAYSARGQRLGEAPYALAADATSAIASFDLPLELRNQVTRIEIAGEPSAGAVHLLDARTQWNRVGLISGETREQAQPLLGPLYYIQKALAPFAELVQPKDSNIAAGLDTIFKQNASIAVLADIGTLTGDLKTRAEDWVRRGGVLVRFAGPRLENGGDDLLPVALRIGGRTLGGALSWSTPQPLAPFPEDSLFAGLAIPADVTVNRQVLADPARLGPEVRIWARLKDGTPLVTAVSRGAGQIVLFHVTANSDWSNLPLSGLFVEMLRRITTLGKLAGGTESAVADVSNKEPATSAENVLAPLQVLDGFGTLRPPLPTVQAVPAAVLDDVNPSVEHPPGYYGPQASPRALNLIGSKSWLRPLPALPEATERRAYEEQASVPLKPWMLATSLALLLTDILAVLLLQIGGLGLKRRRAVPAAGVLALASVFTAALAPRSEAQPFNTPILAPPASVWTRRR